MPRPPTTDRRRFVLLVVGVLLAACGIGAIAWAAGQQRHAPQPTAANAGVIPPATAPSPSPSAPATTAMRAAASPTTAADPRLVLPPSRPVAITIPSIDVHSAVQELGLNPDGTLEVPAPGPHYGEAAWYDGSPTPGQLGPAVIEGHVDSAADGPAVFFRLGALKLGAPVDVRRADGSTAVFTVNAVRRYSKTQFPTDVVYGDSRTATLRLITCGGSFDHETGHYRDNVVVFATLSAVRRG